MLEVFKPAAVLDGQNQEGITSFSCVAVMKNVGVHAGLLRVLKDELVSTTIFAPTEAAFQGARAAAAVADRSRLSLALSNTIVLGRRDVASVQQSMQLSPVSLATLFPSSVSL